LADSRAVFNNSELAPRVVAKETAGVLTVVDGTMFEEIKANVKIP